MNVEKRVQGKATGSCCDIAEKRGDRPVEQRKTDASRDVKVRIDLKLKQSVRALADESDCSFSEFTDLLLVLLKAEYEESKNDELIYDLLRLKGKRVCEVESIRSKPERSACHVALSEVSHTFAIMLTGTYPAVFESVNEVIDLCYTYWLSCCRNLGNTSYVSARVRNLKAGL